MTPDEERAERLRRRWEEIDRRPAVAPCDHSGDVVLYAVINPNGSKFVFEGCERCRARLRPGEWVDQVRRPEAAFAPVVEDLRVRNPPCQVLRSLGYRAAPLGTAPTVRHRVRSLADGLALQVVSSAVAHRDAGIQAGPARPGVANRNTIRYRLIAPLPTTSRSPVSRVKAPGHARRRADARIRRQGEVSRGIEQQVTDR